MRYLLGERGLTSEVPSWERGGLLVRYLLGERGLTSEVPPGREEAY